MVTDENKREKLVRKLLDEIAEHNEQTVNEWILDRQIYAQTIRS
jgi:hypothetical protein